MKLVITLIGMYILLEIAWLADRVFETHLFMITWCWAALVLCWYFWSRRKRSRKND